MPENPSGDAAPPIALAQASVADYCRSLLATRRSETWWFLTGTAPFAGFSRPFADRDGQWWWRAKPLFAWPFDLLTPLARTPRMPLGKSTLGYQYPVPPERANSAIHFNLIRELAGYNLTQHAAQKRRPAVRKGLRSHIVAPLPFDDPRQVEEARAVWNSHVARTAWNTQFDAATFARHWAPLRDMAGTNVLGARSLATGTLCGWLVARVVGDMLHLDTIASHTDRMADCPNDALDYVALYNAARQGVRRANYFLRSSLEPLERFKRSLGFDPAGIPARLVVHPVAALALRLIKPAAWTRLHGDWPPPAATPPATASCAAPPALPAGTPAPDE